MSEKIPFLTKARKDHKCTLCGKIIHKGEFYIFERVTPWSHIDNECFFSYRAHERCEKAWAIIGKEWEWSLPSPRDFNEAVANLIFNDELPNHKEESRIL